MLKTKLFSPQLASTISLKTIASGYKLTTSDNDFCKHKTEEIPRVYTFWQEKALSQKPSRKYRAAALVTGRALAKRDNISA